MKTVDRTIGLTSTRAKPDDRRVAAVSLHKSQPSKSHCHGPRIACCKRMIAVPGGAAICSTHAKRPPGLRTRRTSATTWSGCPTVQSTSELNANSTDSDGRSSCSPARPRRSKSISYWCARRCRNGCMCLFGSIAISVVPRGIYLRLAPDPGPSSTITEYGALARGDSTRQRSRPCLGRLPGTVLQCPACLGHRIIRLVPQRTADGTAVGCNFRARCYARRCALPPEPASFVTCAERSTLRHFRDNRGRAFLRVVGGVLRWS